MGPIVAEPHLASVIGDSFAAIDRGYCLTEYVGKVLAIALGRTVTRSRHLRRQSVAHMGDEPRSMAQCQHTVAVRRRVSMIQRMASDFIAFERGRVFVQVPKTGALSSSLKCAPPRIGVRR